MIITIEGERETGKTLLAREISADRETVWLEEYEIDGMFGLSDILESTQLVIIDNVRNYEKTKSIFDKKNIVVQKIFCDEKVITTPDVILIKE